MGSVSQREIVSRVELLVREMLSARSDGLDLDRIEYRKAGGEWLLRVVLDHPEAVTVEHCEEVSRQLGEALDRTDPIPHSYRLEVSSPGVERPLTREADFERFRGRPVTLRFYGSIDGRKSVTGRLRGLSADGEILVEVPSVGERGYKREDVSRAHLAVDWSRKTGRKGDGGGEE